uniref:Troponin I type 2a (skeletal, fast), tandem duplicate 2 n=1 Tax=Hippocampus comes TaxID=109280 RepID=A0A3Q2Z897_HIPCM
MLTSVKIQWSSYLFLVLAWVFSGYSSFLPHSKNMRGKLIEHSKLSLGVSVSADGCSSLCALRSAGDRFRVSPAYCPKTAGIGCVFGCFVCVCVCVCVCVRACIAIPKRARVCPQSCMLVVANNLLEAEASEKAGERERFLADKCPHMDIPYSGDELRELCKQLRQQIDISEEERYCIEFKLNMVLNEVRDLNIKIVDLRGKFKRPRLKKVRMSADAMLKALLGSKHTVNMDLRANLKQVKKEVKEEDKQLRDVGDWRKNIEDKSDRKKMFDS